MLCQDTSTYTSIEEDVDLHVLYEGLLAVLGQELDIYRELRAILVREKTVLMKPSVQALNESNAKKETCILKAKMLGEARMNCVKRIARCLGIEKDAVNLTTLSSYANDKVKRELKVLQDDLSSLLAEIRELNRISRELLDSSLSFLKGSMDFIHELMSSGPTYLNTGKRSLLPGNGKILQTEGQRYVRY